MIDPTTIIVLKVEQLGDVVTSRIAASDMAAELGFNPVECEEIAIVMSELATNLVKHAHGGQVKLSVSEQDERQGICIETEDHGPGMGGSEQYLTDGYSTGGGLGYGLGSVVRMMDDVNFIAPPDGGTRVICHRWPRPSRTGFRLRDLDIGVATRPRWNQTPNGDSFVIKCWDRHALIGVIDGLGHGEAAMRAAQTARNFIENHYDLPLDLLFKGVDRVCHSTRGVVMALARFNLDQEEFLAANIGNIEVRRYGDENDHNFMVRRGIVGLNAPKPIITTHHWTSNAMLIMFSDGLHTHWGSNDLPPNLMNSPSELAHHLLVAQGKDDDDATIMVVRNVQ